MNACMCVCVYACMYVCMYVYTYTYVFLTIYPMLRHNASRPGKSSLRAKFQADSNRKIKRATGEAAAPRGGGGIRCIYIYIYVYIYIYT